MLSGPVLVLWLQATDVLMRGSLALCLVFLPVYGLALRAIVDCREWKVR